MTTYALNTDEAKAAEYTGGRIEESGKYIGKFTRAEDIKAASGAVGIEFAFETPEGQRTICNIYTLNKSGEPIFGRKMLMALMTCMKVRNIEATRAQVKKWDREAGAEKVVEASVFKELQDKPIGLLLQREEYEKRDGGVGVKMNIAGCFDAATELVASEILDKRTKPEVLPKMLAALRDKPLKVDARPAASAAPSGGGGGFADMDDDIPFSPLRGMALYSV